MFDKKSAKRNICIERIDNIKLRLTEKARKAMQVQTKKKLKKYLPHRKQLQGAEKNKNTG